MILLRVAFRRRLARGAAAVRARMLGLAARLHRLELWANRDLNRLATLAHARMAACSVCPHYNRSLPGVCGQCGCFMPVKTQLVEAKCPLGKW